MLRPAADAKRIEVRASIEASDAQVSADPDRLQQAVWNVVSNAVKFTPAGGRIDLRLAYRDHRAEITVTDTGPGIDASLLPAIFDRFRQGDSGTTRAYGGLGLGLAIARSLVEAHGGTIAAESDGNGRGATFRISLPVQTAQSSPAA
jgi:signal transduction histidine kinase